MRQILSEVRKLCVRSFVVNPLDFIKSVVGQRKVGSCLYENLRRPQQIVLFVENKPVLVVLKNVVFDFNLSKLQFRAEVAPFVRKFISN